MAIFDPRAVKAVATNDSAFNLSLRSLTGKIRFQIGDDSYLLEFRDGVFVDFGREDGSVEADVVLLASTDSWERLLVSETTPPGHQNVLFNDGRTGVTREGDPVAAVAPLGRVIYEFSRVLRQVVTGKPRDTVLPEVEREFDAAIGRYVYLKIQGVQYRVYYEEAGTGPIPLLYQHTAGADSRQARHLLEDPDFQKHFRVIAYDLPFHGRSLPPTSHKWWDEAFCLTKAFLLELIHGICNKLRLERPVFMGSAMGGMLALDLAYDDPNKFRAVIGLNAGPSVDFPEAVLDLMKTFSHPRVSNYWQSTLMMANMAGTSPEVYRRELGWVYNQSAPGIAEGALNYYCHDHDLSLEQAGEIDTSKVKVYLFTGADDSMSMEGEFGTAQLAKHMRNVPFKVLPRLGHFGASENPEAFKEDLWPTLEEIIRASA